MKRFLLSRVAVLLVSCFFIGTGSLFFFQDRAKALPKFLFICFLGILLFVHSMIGILFFKNKQCFRIGQFRLRSEGSTEIEAKLPRDISSGRLFLVLHGDVRNWFYFNGEIHLCFETELSTREVRFALPIVEPLFRSKWHIPKWL